MIRARPVLPLLTLAVGVAAVAASAPFVEVEFSEAQRKRILRHSPLPEPPPDPTNAVTDDANAAALGKRLFFDTRLSANGELSCASCHDPQQAFTDGKSLAEGLGTTTRNSPPLYNLGHNRWFFWDGRADTLWAQALQPIEHPDELGGNRLGIAHLIAGDEVLREAYEASFGPIPDVSDLPPDARPVVEDPDDPLNRVWETLEPEERETINRIFANVGKAMAAYERLLVSRRSPFDVFAEGLRSGDSQKLDAISPAAKRGLVLFAGRANCRICHTGPNFTDGEFHNTAVPPLDGGLPRDPGRYRGADLVRDDPFGASGPYSDEPDGPTADRARRLANGPDNWGRFKTPSLRNVALTAPYMHQGQFGTLRDVIRFYSTREGAVQMDHHAETILVPLDLSDGEIEDLVAFLESLTDDSVPEELRRPPPAR
jgi:cytochrome c peroxidase